ncbi:hypothetical protein E2C01_041962 [Portunus trituberculatus]|uniref:Uncharacterized protein n=1 Tax=Portunus trituberculatus TaxID=210409 RepID=A0A5B7FV53_PORTR|nr:hypothetical protein [Portunus trituberculatus]
MTASSRSPHGHHPQPPSPPWWAARGQVETPRWPALSCHAHQHLTHVPPSGPPPGDVSPKGAEEEEEEEEEEGMKNNLNHIRRNKKFKMMNKRTETNQQKEMNLSVNREP